MVRFNSYFERIIYWIWGLDIGNKRGRRIKDDVYNFT